VTANRPEYFASDILTFTEGIPGFPDRKKFVIVQEEEIAPFEWLLNIDDEMDLRFAVVNPLCVHPEYNPDIPDSFIRDLEITSSDEAIMYVIVTIQDNLADTTVNLAGPVIINTKKRLAKQILLDSDEYSTKEPLMRD
jgi:flagellar assembly factor FliW